MHPILGVESSSTRIWNSLVFFNAGVLSSSVAISVALCLQYFKCWVIFAFSNSPLQKLHTPFETSLVAALFAISFSSQTHPGRSVFQKFLLPHLSCCNKLITSMWFIGTSNSLKTRTITRGVIILRVHTARVEIFTGNIRANKCAISVCCHHTMGTRFNQAHNQIGIIDSHMFVIDIRFAATQKVCQVNR